MLNTVPEACRKLSSFSDFWLVAALGDWSFEEGDRNASFVRYVRSWDQPDFPLPIDLLRDVRLGINGVLCRLIGQQPDVESCDRNPSYGPDIVFRASGCSFSVEVKYIFDCAYTKQYETAIPADRDKRPDFQIVFFISFPNYRYPAGRWYGGGWTKSRQTNVIGVAAQYRKVCQFLGKTASWPGGTRPFCADLPQGTEIVTQDRIQRRFAAAFQPGETWQFSTTEHLRGAQVGFAVWDWRGV